MPQPKNRHENPMTFLARGAALFIPLIFLLLAASPAEAAPQWTHSKFMYVTFYGWVDNSPPGRAIAYPVIHKLAGGVGTYKNPIIFATDKNELAIGTIVYVPYLQKYFIMEDDCAQCDSDWQHHHKFHIDLWTGGNGSHKREQIQCENSLTRNGDSKVIINPPGNLPVVKALLFDASTGKCYHP